MKILVKKYFLFKIKKKEKVLHIFMLSNFIKFFQNFLNKLIFKKSKNFNFFLNFWNVFTNIKKRFNFESFVIFFNINNFFFNN